VLGGPPVCPTIPINYDLYGTEQGAITVPKQMENRAREFHVYKDAGMLVAKEEGW
jgi:hypothetical protein